MPFGHGDRHREVRRQAERPGLDSDEAFEGQIRQLAEELDDDREKVLEGVEAVVSASADASGGSHGDVRAVFRRVLGKS